MTVKLLTEQHLGFLRLTGGCRGSSESTHVKIATLLEITCQGSIKSINCDLDLESAWLIIDSAYHLIEE